MEEDRLLFCRHPFCTERLRAHEICAKDGDSSVTAAEKLIIDTEASERELRQAAKKLPEDGYACLQCEFFSNMAGECPARHKLKSIDDIRDEYVAWHEERVRNTESLLGIKNSAPKKQVATTVKAYLAQLMWKALNNAGIRDAVTINEWQQKSEALEPDAFLAEAMKFNPPLDLSALENYIKATKITTMAATTSVKYAIGEEILTAFLPAFSSFKEDGKTYAIITTDLELSYEQIKTALRQILPDYFNTNVNMMPPEMFLPFVISKEKHLEGQVISNLDNAKKSVTLMNVYAQGGNFIYQFFGENKPPECKREKVFMRYNESFHVYKFQADNSEEIVLLSLNELELSGCRIYGMEAQCYDFLKIGNMAKINTTQKVFFVHSQKPSIETISEKSFWTHATKYGKQEIHEALFGKYPHPEWFSAFISAWAFSGKLSDMPTHLSLMSPPALGKTKMLENLGKAFDQPINDGGTIKGLVPSFANGIPKEGYLIKCRRFGFVDEFLHIIQSSSRNGSDFDGGSFQLLKVLEHSEGEHSSGFGIIKAKPKMWAIFCSNIRPYEHIKNLVDLHEKLNVAFMSRILWYVYDKEHVDFINSRKGEVMKFNKEKTQPKHDTIFISMIDYMHSVTLDIPLKVIEDIHAKYRPYVPAPLELDIYDSRMIMHIYRIMDGYAKYKSVIEKRGSFVCTEQDIQEVDALMGRIIKSWSLNIDAQHMTPAMRLAYLTALDREVFDFIKINQSSGVGGKLGGVDENLLLKLKGTVAVEIADALVRQGILKEVPGIGYKVYLTYDVTI